MCYAIDYFISWVTSDFTDYAIKVCFVVLCSRPACGHADFLTLSNVFVDIAYLSEDLVLNYTINFNKTFPIHF